MPLVECLVATCLSLGHCSFVVPTWIGCVEPWLIVISQIAVERSHMSDVDRIGVDGVGLNLDGLD